MTNLEKDLKISGLELSIALREKRIQELEAQEKVFNGMIERNDFTWVSRKDCIVRLKSLVVQKNANIEHKALREKQLKELRNEG